MLPLFSLQETSANFIHFKFKSSTAIYFTISDSLGTQHLGSASIFLNLACANTDKGLCPIIVSKHGTIIGKSPCFGEHHLVLFRFDSLECFSFLHSLSFLIAPSFTV